MWTSDSSNRTERVAVIGLGNPLMGDDGLGLAALGRLHDEWELDGTVVLVDGGTWGLSLLPIIECTDRLLLLDAIRANRAPGSLVMLAGDDVPKLLQTKLSPHQIDVREVLALARFRGTLPKDVVALGIEPSSVELRDTLSPPVTARMEQLISLTIDRLQAWGVRCTPKEAEVGACTR